jgi:hypothetical protein
MIMATTIPPDELAVQNMITIFAYLAIGLSVAGAAIAAFFRIRRGTA